jgi:hypothetical protein
LIGCGRAPSAGGRGFSFFPGSIVISILSNAQRFARVVEWRGGFVSAMTASSAMTAGSAMTARSAGSEVVDL